MIAIGCDHGGYRLKKEVEKYLDEKILGGCIDLLNEIINNPLIVDGGFSEEYLKIEKEISEDKCKVYS